MLGENVAIIQKGTTDRISELPEFILHIILAMLDTEEACRASVLSKTWFAAWSSIPVLDFQSPFGKNFGVTYDDDKLERFVGYIDKIMERYITRKYRITKMYLTLPKVDEKLESLVDKWIMIAVQNQIERLEIVVISEYKYRLPEILFSAKSLKVLILLGPDRAVGDGGEHYEEGATMMDEEACDGSTSSIDTTSTSSKKKRKSDCLADAVTQVANTLQSYVEARLKATPTLGGKEVFDEVSKVVGILRPQILQAVNMFVEATVKFQVLKDLPSDQKLDWILLCLDERNRAF